MSLFDRSTAWVEQKGMNGPDAPIVLPVSGLVRDELLKIYNIPESKLHVIHPGVSEERFSSLNPSECRLEVRRRHGLSQEDVVVLFVGMNFEIKRLDLVINGVSELIKKGKVYSRLKILVVGKGNTKRYQAMADQLGIGERVIFVGVTRDVAKYYYASDIFALPSEFDAFPLATLEAMAAGLPVIISGHVGTKDIIENGAHGFVLEDHPSALSFSKSLSLLMDKEKRLEMGRRAVKTARQHTWAKTADQVAEFYHRFGRI
jgi:UDP-glucose:(heptosyl)LPS alpha-1,3-glucosyltransferase